MADTLLSLATDLLKPLGSIAVQEIKLIVGVDEEIERLSRIFKIVQKMLNNAEERQFTDEVVRLWLDQLRDVYYMMDDVLDKWDTARRIKSETQNEEERAVNNNNPAALAMKLECLPPLGKLPLLKELCIWTAIKVKKLGDEFLGIESENKSKKDDCHIINIFPNLRVLKIWYLESCEEWIGMGGKGLEVEEEKHSGLVLDPVIKIMPRLERLEIEDCDKLKCLPDYLRTTPLQELSILDCSILRQRCEREIGDYWPIISHIPTIIIDDKDVQINGQPQFDSNNQSKYLEDLDVYEVDEQVEEDIDEGDS